MTRRLFLVLLSGAALLQAQSQPRQVGQILEQPLQSPEVSVQQLRQYLVKKVPPLKVPGGAAAWRSEAAALRARILSDIVFHGWPKEWVEAQPRFEDMGTVPSGEGYRTRKLRYEIVPGFFSTAILYEPLPLNGKVPAVLNVNGHVGAPGKAVEYKQKRCIQQARMGMLSLNLEWFSYGDLGGSQNSHWYGAHLDLAGANGVGLFYLAMRKGLDYLEKHPNADSSRLGVTGLSGGGWQTIVLSSLDDRVAVSVPVAGYSGIVSRIERPGDVGDIEQNPTDFHVGRDYTHLTAMRAPRPTLQIYNAEDDCCFRAPLVKPHIHDAVKPFFALYGKADALAWHENTDPSDHNYQLDNRTQSHRFFARHFGLPEFKGEAGVDAEVKTVEELSVPLPEGNLTILGLARKMAAGIERPAPDRDRLRKVLRFAESPLRRAWGLANTKNKGLESSSWRFEFANDLTATGVLFKAISARPASAVIVLHDGGRKAAGVEVSDRVNRGQLVLAADLLFTGDAAPQRPGPLAFAQLLATTGDRPLAMEAAQLIALAEWLSAGHGVGPVAVSASGIRSQMIALAAAALRPRLFASLEVKNGMKSLAHLLDAPVEYQAAPDLFCLDLYREFDIKGLEALAAPVRIR